MNNDTQKAQDLLAGYNAAFSNAETKVAGKKDFRVISGARKSLKNDLVKAGFSQDDAVSMATKWYVSKY